MNYSFEYIDIILLAMIAGFIILRLRGILGRRTGHETKPINKFNDQYLNKNQDDKEEINILNRIDKELNPEQKKQFLKGAKLAYETIITSFAKGDKSSLKNLLNKKMHEEFSNAIDERKKEEIKSELTFIGIKSAEIENFEREDNIYKITVKFVSEIITCLKDKQNKIVEGDPDVIKTVNDKWLFSKNMWSSNPTWYLIGTNN